MVLPVYAQATALFDDHVPGLFPRVKHGLRNGVVSRGGMANENDFNAFFLQRFCSGNDAFNFFPCVFLSRLSFFFAQLIYGSEALLPD